MCADFSFIGMTVEWDFSCENELLNAFYVENIYVFIHCSWTLFIVAISAAVLGLVLFCKAIERKKKKKSQLMLNKRQTYFFLMKELEHVFHFLLNSCEIESGKKDRKKFF